jgi:hypothetical protein
MSHLHKKITWPDIATNPDDGDPEYTGNEWEPGDELDASGEPTYYHYHLAPGTYAGIWLMRQEEWDDIARDYEQHPGDFYLAHQYIDSHPIFWSSREGFTDSELPPNHVIRVTDDTGITRGCYIYPVKCNPANQTIEDDETLNTHTMIWYEFGPIDLLPQNHGGAGTLCAAYHDYELDGGADTYEQAIIDIALKIWTKYGNDRQICDKLPVNAIEDLDAAD